MSDYQPHSHATEIQILSLRTDNPESQDGALEATALTTLELGLKAMNDHPDCIGVYSMSQDEDPQKIVIISKWKKAVDTDVSRVHLREMIPHLKSPPLPSVHVNHPLYSHIGRNTNFLTIYFPASTCTKDFQTSVLARVEQFSEMTMEEGRRYFFSMASGWITETQKLNGVLSMGFLCYITWRNKMVEPRAKKQGSYWDCLVNVLKNMGAHQQYECHGILREFGDLEQPDDSIDTVEKEMEDNLSSSGSFRSTHDRSSYCHEVEFGSCHSFAISSAEAGKEATGGNDMLDKVGNRDVELPDLPAEIETWKSSFSDSDDNSPNSSPILTPSSSCMSLNSLYEDSRNAGQYPSTSVSSHHKFDNTVDEELVTSAIPGGWEESDDERQTVNTHQSTVSPLPSEVGISAAANGAINLPVNTTAVCHRSYPTRGFRNETRKISPVSLNNKKTVTGLLYQYGVSPWNPDNEIKSVKSRFEKYSKRGPAAKSGHEVQLAAQTAEVRFRQWDPAPVVKDLKVAVIKPHKSDPWWKIMAGIWLKTAVSPERGGITHNVPGGCGDVVEPPKVLLSL